MKTVPTIHMPLHCSATKEETKFTSWNQQKEKYIYFALSHLTKNQFIIITQKMWYRAYKHTETHSQKQGYKKVWNEALKSKIFASHHQAIMLKLRTYPLTYVILTTHYPTLIYSEVEIQYQANLQLPPASFKVTAGRKRNITVTQSK